MAAGQDHALIRNDVLHQADEAVHNGELRHVRRRAPLILRSAAFVFPVAAPDGPSIPVRGMPDLGTVKASAVPADDATGEQPLPAVPVAVLLPRFNLQLHQLVYLFGNDGRVAVPHIILGNLTLVLFELLGQKVRTERLLENGVTFIALIPQDGHDRALAPDLPASRRRNVLLRQGSGDLMGREPIEVSHVNRSDDLGFFGDNLGQAVVTLPVAEEGTVGHQHFAVREALPDTPGHVL